MRGAVLALLFGATSCCAAASLPESLVVTGARTFGDEALRAALAGDLEVVLAACPGSPEDELAAVLAARTLAGYRHLGFPDARATVERRAPGFVVLVEEGRRLLACDVRSTGNVALTTAEVSAVVLGALRPAAGPGPAATGPLRLDEPGLRGAAEALARRYAEAGYLFAAADVAVMDDPVRPGWRCLGVTVRDEGGSCRRGSLEVTGLKMLTAAEVEGALQIPEGAELNRKVLEAAERRLRETGRFLKARVEAKRGARAGSPALVVSVEEADGARPLREPFRPAEAAFLSMRSWVEGFPAGSDGLTVSAAFAGGWRLAATVSPRRGLSLDVGRGLAPELQVRWTPEAFEAAAEGALLVPAGEGELTLQLHVQPAREPQDGNPFSLFAGASWSAMRESTGPLRFDVRLAPVAFLGLAGDPGTTAVTSSDGTLDVWCPREGGRSLTLRVAPGSGRLERLALIEADGSVAVEVGAVPASDGSTAPPFLSGGAAQRFDPARPLATLGCFCVDAAARLLLPRGAPVTAVRLLRDLVAAPVLAVLDAAWAARPRAGPGEPFVIPTPPGDPARSVAAPLVAALRLGATADWLLPAGAWPREVCSVLLAASAGRGAAAGAALALLVAREDLGPAAWLATAFVVARLDPRAASAAAARGLVCFQRSGMADDARFVTSVAPARACLAAVALALGRAEAGELEQLRSLTGEPWAAVLGALAEPAPALTAAERALGVVAPEVTARLRALAGEGPATGAR